jgi:hypothetical protein
MKEEGRRKKEEGRGLKDVDSDPNSKDKTLHKLITETPIHYDFTQSCN